jgi:glycosyltransferase involved in cell wall biosynthesis
MEAAVVEVPTIAWKTPFLDELLVDGVSAVLVRQGDVSAFEESLVALIHSAERRCQLGRKARERMRHEYSVDSFVRKLTSVYEELLGTSDSFPVLL